MLSPIITLIIGMALLIFLGKLPKGRLLQIIAISVLFLFSIANIDDKVGIFYGIMTLFVLVFYSLKLYEELDARERNVWLQIGVGVGIFLFLYFVSGRQAASIIGVPKTFAIKSTFTPLLTSVLGYTENLFFFGLFAIFKKYASNIFYLFSAFLGSLATLILPFVLAAGLFATFHLTAYSLSFGLMLSAFFVFMLFLFSATMGFIDGANLAHALWNGFISLRRVLVI